MSITHGDKLFVYYAANRLPAHGRYSFFGNDFGSIVGFSQYIDGYVFAVEALYREYISCDEYRNDILDTIVYPLCFNYRQIVELNIKYLFFKYADVDATAKENFVKQVSHKLNKAWAETKPHIEKLLRKIGDPIDISLFDDFIDQIDTFDTDSFRMRYPIRKDLQSVHAGPVKLDVVGLHQKMMDLFELFRQLDFEIDCVIIENTCEEEFIKRVRDLYSDGKSDILAIMGAMQYLAGNQKKHQLETSEPAEVCVDFSMIDITPDPEQLKFEKMVLGLPNKHAAILALLTHVGGNIVDRRCRLATSNEEERKKDLFKLLDMTLKECSSFISLDGHYPCNQMCYALLEKSVDVPLKWLEASIPLMESAI